MPKEPQGRIPESIDFESVNKEVDGIIQTALGMLKDPSRGGTASADGSIPAFEEIDLSAVRDEVNNVRGRRTATNLQITENERRLAEATDRRKDVLEDQANAKRSSIIANQARAQEEALIYASLAQGMQLRPEDVIEVSQKLREERVVGEAMLDEIQRMQSVGLLDNPLEWLANQIQMPSIIEPYNRQVDKVNSLQDMVDTGLATAQQAATFNIKAIPTITAAQAKAAADIATAEGKLLQITAEENLAKESTNYAVQRLSNDLSAATTTMNMSQLEIQQNTQKFQSALRAIDNADNNATRLLKAAELLEKLERTKGLDVILANYDRMMGHPRGTTTRYNFERFGQTQKENIIAIGAGSGGSNPLESMINFSMARPGPEISPQSLRINNWLQERVSAIGSDPNVQRLDEKQKPLAINKKLLEEIEIEKNLAYRPGNLFYEISPAEMIASGTVPAESKLAKALEPFTNISGPVPTEIIATAIRREFPNPTQAAAVLADYYKKNINLRNMSANLEFFHIKPPTEYRVPINGIFFNKFKLDLTRPDQALKYYLVQDQVQALKDERERTPLGPEGQMAPRNGMGEMKPQPSFRDNVRGNLPSSGGNPSGGGQPSNRVRG